MASVCPLFSGSSGNSTYIGCASGGVLIDAGVGARSIFDALSALDIELETINAVFVTHEHSDHIRGLAPLQRKYGLRVFASQQTAAALSGEAEVEVIGGDGTEMDGMLIQRFPTSHDCSGSSGYTVCTPDGRRIGVCTDLGHMTDDVRSALYGCDLVLIESNHDVNMLKNGRYPYHTKLRILSDRGHLSNACCADELPGLVRTGTTRVILGHISRDNNFPELALATARSALTVAGLSENQDYLLSVASPSGSRLTVL